MEKTGFEKEDTEVGLIWLSVAFGMVWLLLLPGQSVARVPGSRDKQQTAETLRVVHGKVTDENGAPIVGANVWIKGTMVGVATDVNGDYTLRINRGEDVECSFIGYSEAEKTIMPGIEVYNFTLKPEARKLDEVVVVGYGTTRLRDLTGSVSSVGAADLEKEPVMNVASALQGKAPGVQVSMASAKPGEPVKIRVRGPLRWKVPMNLCM